MAKMNYSLFTIRVWFSLKRSSRAPDKERDKERNRDLSQAASEEAKICRCVVGRRMKNQ